MLADVHVSDARRECRGLGLSAVKARPHAILGADPSRLNICNRDGGQRHPTQYTGGCRGLN
jgi:hypothetical protein